MIKLSNFISAIFIFTFIISSQISSQEVYQGKIKISATRNKGFIQEQAEKIEVITRENILHSGANTIAEALENHPGVTIRSDGLRGRNIQLQGFTGKHVLFLINGVRVIGRLNEEIDLTRIKAEEIERIEILKGAASTIYGSEAIGGIVNIITRSSQKPLFIELQSQVGQSNSRYQSSPEHHENILIGFSKNKHSSTWQLGVHQSDGYDLDPPSSEDDTARRNTNGSQYLEFNIGNRNSFWSKSNANINLDWNYRNLSQFRNVATTFNQNIDLERHENEIQDLQIQFRPQFFFERSTLKILYGYSTYQDKNTRDGIRLRKDEQSENYNQLNFQFEQDLFARDTFLIGFETLAHDIFSTRIANNSEITFNQHSGFMQYERIFKQNKSIISIVPAFRYSESSDFPSTLTSSLAFLFDFSALKVRASVSQGYRVPSPKERFFDFDHSQFGYRVVGNENLEPETSLNSQISLEYSKNNYWFTTTLFQNQVQNFIELYPETQDSTNITTYKSQNIQEAFINGLEMSLKIQWLMFWSTTFSYVYNNSQDLQRNIPFDRHADHRFSYKLDYWNAKKQIGFYARGTLTGPLVVYDIDTFADP